MSVDGTGGIESLEADRAPLSLVTCESISGLMRTRVWAVVHVRCFCIRRHKFAGSATLRGHTEVRPPSGQAHTGLARGQLKARRRPLASREPPKAAVAPSKVTWLLSARGVGPGAGRQQQRAINPCLPAAPSPCQGFPECPALGPSSWAPGAQEWPLRMGAKVRAASATPYPLGRPGFQTPRAPCLLESS